MSLKSAIGEYGNKFLKPVATSLSRHTGRCTEICCRQCLSNRVPWMSTVRQFIWERLFESTNYILEVVKLDNIHLFNTPHKRQRTNTCGLVSSLKSQTATFSRDCMLHLSFVMGTLMNYFSLTRISHVHHHCHSVSRMETQTGHQIGHYSMPRRCPSGAR